MKFNHEEESLASAIGVTTGEMVNLSIKVARLHNGPGRRSEALEKMMLAVREHVMGESGEELSKYEVILASVMLSTGEALGKSASAEIAEKCIKVTSAMKVAGAPDEVILMIMAEAIVAIAGGPDGHKCSKCGKCGKEFDAEGNQTGGPGFSRDRKDLN